MDLGIRNKTALVFGASRGIGRGIAEELAAEGVNLLLAARSEETLKNIALQISQQYQVKVNYLAVDIGKVGAVDTILSMVERTVGNIDILVNISGGPTALATSDVPGAEYTRQFDLMVSPFIDISRLIGASMAQRKWGRIITVASSGVEQPINDLALSNVLRLGLAVWNKTLAGELAKSGVTVNTLIPGRIHTERVEELDRSRAVKSGKPVNVVISESLASIPTKRYGTVKEFAAMATFLASERASYITGSCIRIDGGLVGSVF